MERTRNKDGTYANENYSTYINKSYGKLTIIEMYRSKTDNRIRCKCICACGNNIDLDFRQFRSRQIKDCGCTAKESIYEEIIGKRFGKLLVVERLPFQNLTEAKYKCYCDCGNYVEVNRYNLLYGTYQTKSCGCIQKISNISDKIYKSNTSGIRGVHYEVNSQKWVAKLTIKRKAYKKRFTRFEDAVLYRKLLEEEHHNKIKEEFKRFKS